MKLIIAVDVVLASILTIFMETGVIANTCSPTLRNINRGVSIRNIFLESAILSSFISRSNTRSMFIWSINTSLIVQENTALYSLGKDKGKNDNGKQIFKHLDKL
ncbi:uncharacterized protein BX664DRAFT_330511 [Halteromyces radiatus]|uniref:uncharacterized protein n=1 Tax=Halteromyces radiatus TaxID=101107 RepID=UPI00221EF087|nr:uncharacterized protein BX664DRAFT_330511 [Halteromyces radiatus]KAI8093760.1 hypothetical protein BX664DRAFT_330511 [Halteromyces radiatus]